MYPTAQLKSFFLSPAEKRADSISKTDDELTRDKLWDDNDKDGDQLDESKDLENNNEDEDEASVER